MSLLERIAALLAERGLPHALIGATALAVHGISRSTVDQDLLVVDPRALDTAFWQPIGADAEVDIRKGDAEDPLLGLVRSPRRMSSDAS